MSDNLAVKYNEYLKIADPEATFDDFFDWAEVPKDHRTDFAIAAILQQASELFD